MDFSLSTGMLARIYPGGHPLYVGPNPWLGEVDRFLLGLAERLYRAVPFGMAAVGEEVSGWCSQAEPPARWMTTSGLLPSGLRWVPHQPRPLGGSR